MGNTITFNGASSNNQIQQGVIGASQTQTNTESCSDVDEVLRRILEITQTVEFSETFGNHAEEVRSLVNDGAALGNEASEVDKKKEILLSIKTIAEQVGASVVAAGIISLITGVL